MAEKVVRVKEVERIKDEIENILKNSTLLPTLTQIDIPTEGIELNEKEISIHGYIINNQGVIKEQVVDAFKEKAGYSRKPVFKILNRLEKNGWIKVRPDLFHGHKLHLYPNHQCEMGSFVESIASFTTNYCNLITDIKEKDFEEHEKAIDFSAIIIPLKFFIRLFSNSILWSMPYQNKEILHRKFAVISNAMESIHVVLCDTMLSKGWIQNSEEIKSEIMTDDLDISPDKILNMLRTFEKYGLRENAEMVLDCLWNIGPIISLMYPYYSLKNPDVLKDWRKLLVEYDRFAIPAKRFDYRVSKTV